MCGANTRLQVFAVENTELAVESRIVLNVCLVSPFHLCVDNLQRRKYNIFRNAFAVLSKCSRVVARRTKGWTCGAVGEVSALNAGLHNLAMWGEEHMTESDANDIRTLD